MTRIAIIGAGAVGATAAYYLSKDPTLAVTVFDHGQGQATKAAAGIISPWFSKRRNKAWYRLASAGAAFYPELVADLTKSGQDTDFYQQSGVLVLKKDESKLDELYELAKSRQADAQVMGDLAIVTRDEMAQRFPALTGFERALYASGGARVDGLGLTETLLAASGLEVVTGQVSLSVSDQGYEVAGRSFDQVILATGAWLPQILAPLGYRVDVRPQKGQLQDYTFADLETADYPVVMPEGELDIIPFAQGQISLGASHENDMGYDLSLDPEILAGFEVAAQPYFQGFDQAQSRRARVGTRAYTSDFAPFYGEVPGLPGVYAASGLGSTGLTIGPLLGKILADTLLGRPQRLPAADYPIENYVKRSEEDR